MRRRILPLAVMQAVVLLPTVEPVPLPQPGENVRAAEVARDKEQFETTRRATCVLPS